MTSAEKLRFLIGDEGSERNFTDDQLQVLLDLNDGSLYLSAAVALEKLAAKAASGLTDITLGSLRINEASMVRALQDQASRFRTLEYDTPAFAVAEENLSGFNELTIIRNWILRTEIDLEA